MHTPPLGSPSFTDRIRSFLRTFTQNPDYQVFVDIWEGQGAIDWQALDVAAVAIRLNNISGGTHADDLFEPILERMPKTKIPLFCI